jgi:alpha-tubulin suppressor-like RCC1 family protein
MISKKYLNVTLVSTIVSFGITALVACSPDSRNSVTKDLVTDLGEDEGTFYYKLDGENLTRAKCLEGESTVSLCQEGKEIVNYKRFQLAFVEDTAGTEVAERQKIFELIESPVAFRPMDDNNLFSEQRPLLMKVAAAYGKAKRGEIMVAVASGHLHTCGLTEGGKAYCWGDNTFGQLGKGSVSRHHDPIFEPTAVIGGLVFSALTAGNSHTCGLAESGKAYCWGMGIYSQLGDGTSSTNKHEPTAVAGELVFSALTAGNVHTCGLSEGGKAYCWGSTWVGDGTSGEKSVPTAVAGELVFSALSAGYRHTCGLAEDGKAYCWGEGEDGQLGNGSIVRKLEPTAVYGELVFRSLTAGYAHTCGLAEDGKAYCWGKGIHGQLGNGTIVDKLEPTAIISELVFSVLRAGGHRTCGLVVGGKTYCWGSTSNGLLGRVDWGNKIEPTVVTGELAFSELTAGDYHNCGIAEGGKAYCWGMGGNGQLGHRDYSGKLERSAVGGVFGW